MWHWWFLSACLTSKKLTGRFRSNSSWTAGSHRVSTSSTTFRKVSLITRTCCPSASLTEPKFIVFAVNWEMNPLAEDKILLWIQKPDDPHAYFSGGKKTDVNFCLLLDLLWWQLDGAPHPPDYRIEQVSLEINQQEVDRIEACLRTLLQVFSLSNLLNCLSHCSAFHLPHRSREL